MATTIEDRIKQQEEKLKELKARKAKIEAQQKAAEAKQNRADDTRRKILLGSLFLDSMNKDEVIKNNIITQLNRHLKRPHDRALFGLKPLEQEPA